MNHAASPETELSTVKRALLALQTTRAKLEALEQAQTEPIAIIGMGCRLPGDIATPEAFWELLRDGRETISPVPASRWDSNRYYDPDYDAPGKIVTRVGSFLTRIQDSDPQFFGISPREAMSMDPQQHLLLEVCWEALEHAGLVPADLAGSRTGVFIGICNQDYSVLLMSREAIEIDAYMTTGMAHSVAAGRLAYSMGFQGPCLAVDTACSSSLVAVHLACQSLRNRECDLAVSGGVNLILCPETSINFSRNHMLSPDGRCKSFDATANGFGRGEGCGLIVLKRLSDVVPGSDRVLALIRGSASNQDGATSGLTVPNGPAQQTVIRDALRNAGVAAEQIDYVEAHGTGTKLGDPIEIGALNAVFGPTRSSRQPLIVGSVKTNLGHLEGAAGISALMKVVLALSHQQIPRHLHCDQPTPFIPWAEIPIRVATQAIAWPATEKPRLAGVSSFGFSGSNVHVVLEGAPLEVAPANEAAAERPLHLLCLSARTRDGLTAQAARYADYLGCVAPTALADVCYSANTSRSVFEYRLLIAAADPAEMRGKLAQGCNGADQGQPGAYPVEPPRIAWLFSGQGAQYPGMGADLYQTQPVFRRAMDDCAQYLDPLLGLSLTGLLFDTNSTDLHQTAYTQPALFALEYALAQMWLSWGLQADAVTGHSVGEYVAACIAGVFSLEDGLKLIAARARLMQALPGNGAMAAVFADAHRVKQAIAALENNPPRIAIAAINSLGETVVSGQRQAIETLLKQLTEAGISSRELTVSHAFHSALMEPMLAEYRQVVAGVALRPPRIRLVSNISGHFVSDEVTDPDYWCRHIRETVLFAGGINTLRQHGIAAFVEIGPHPVLLGLVRADAPPANRELYLPSLRKGQADWPQLAQSLSELYLAGAAIDWKGFDRPYPRHRLTLPTYPFQRKRHWYHDSPTIARQPAAPNSPLLSLLQAGNAEALSQYLQSQGELSADELRLLPKLSGLLIRGHQSVNANLDSLCYRPIWQQQSRLSASALAPGAAPSRPWLIFSSDEAAELTQGFQDAGLTGIRVSPGNRYAQTASDVWSLDAENADDYRVLLEAIQPQAIVYLWPSAPTPPDALGEAALMQVILLARAAALQPAVKLWLITPSASNAADHAPTSPFPWLLTGLARSLFLEYPQLKGGVIDLDPGETPALIRELLNPGDEDAISLRGGKRYVARLAGYPPPPAAVVRCKADGAYLISGGLGALGLKTARFLAENGAGQLILLGRKAPGEAARDTLDFIRQLGVQVRLLQADSGDEAAMSELFKQIATGDFRLKGIIHAAGVLSTRSLNELDREGLSQVLAPKLRGAWTLHRLSMDLQLDFFVLYSSISAVLGTAQLAAYTAANGFLDGLAAYRQGLGLPVLSINWGPWQTGGMIADETATQVAASGFTPLDAHSALALFGRLLASSQSRVAVVDADWPRLKSLYEIRGPQPLLALLGQNASPAVTTAPSSTLNELRALTARDQFDYLVSRLQELVGAALGFDSNNLPDPKCGFFDMGMDSLTAVELKGRIEAKLQRSLPPSVVFDYPNVEGLAAHLLELLFPTARQDQPVASAIEQTEESARSSRAEIQQLSDAELAALIDDEFSSLTQ
ncbi:type I polyketide synthase [Methylomonas albis]|uniref:Type I polyketide synthase n=1 Tax=Methylomonas albis TaxID=1854563 RepID=A0ABR9D713_9GAMM|nr:type I polyketide synthase [Methylomonas albis]MBD9358029.1 type I polyketide synthase [Methylomonas albis]